MRSSVVMILVAASAILVLAAVILYSLFAKQMYSQDRRLVRGRRPGGAPEKAADEPE